MTDAATIHSLQELLDYVKKNMNIMYMIVEM